MAEITHRKPGRPTKAKNRPQRIAVGLNRDVLNIYNKDPGFYYYFTLDTTEDGATIQEFLRAGYEFVNAETHGVPRSQAFQSNKLGSIIRIPAGKNSPGKFHYAMRQPMEFHKEDQAKKQEAVDAIDDIIHRRGVEEKLNHDDTRGHRPIYYDSEESAEFS